MSVLLASILLFVLSFTTVVIVYPTVCRAAVRNGIIDNPGERKLQKQPVPVAGGIAVFAGVAAGLLVGDMFFTIWKVSVLLSSMLVLLIIGVTDDIKTLTPKIRVLIEILVTYMFITGTDLFIGNFNTLWGIEELPLWVAYVISIVAGVGILNAMNLIDGVDGLCSGFAIVASIVFAGLFFKLYSPRLGCIGVVCAASILPFFFHNVFGKKSKMFLGDGGSLVLGLMMIVFVFSAFSNNSPALRLAGNGVGSVAIVLAVMSVPVFDTLRVMASRIIHGCSPFLPDNNHLHHDFIKFGFSHLATTLCMIVLDLLVLLSWRIAYDCGGSVDVQFYAVLGSAILVTLGTHLILKAALNREDSGIHCFLVKVGQKSRAFEKTKFWASMERIADKRF